MVSDNNRRIAKNTLFLYFRMLLIMAVTLYTSRVVLSVLGAEDFGIYNVVGGVVLIFSFLNSMLTSASQRFFSYEIGINNRDGLLKIFRLNILIFIVFLLFAVLLSETIGLYFVNTQLIIPEERISAANYVFQFSILSFCVTFITIPFNALIVSYERMSAFAYISIFEVVFKLILVFIIANINIDKLVAYSVLIFVVQTLIMLVYMYYCRKYFGVNFGFYWDKSKAIELLSFTSWHVFGTLAMVLRSQGVNILLNMFFNPTINAARAIAYQVNSAILSFSNNFFVAVKPQIYKSYAQGCLDSMINLVFKGSRFSFFLLLFLGLPIFFEVDSVLSFWLNEVPDYTSLFVKLIIINALLDSFNVPMTAAVLAVGRIRQYQIVVSFILLLNLPISYVFLKYGYSPEITMLVSIVMSFILIFVRVYLLHKLISFSYKKYYSDVLWPIVKVSVISSILSYICVCLLGNYVDSSIFNVIIVCFCSLFSIVILGLNKKEKYKIIHVLINKFRI